MAKVRDSISRKLTVLNMLVSGTAVLLASAALFAYDLTSFRDTMLSDLSIQAQIIGYESVTPIVFNDSESAEQALAALRASPHIVYAAVYKPNGEFFAGYWRDPKDQGHPLPVMAPYQTNRWMQEQQFAMARPIPFGNQSIGVVYIRSDLAALLDRLKNYLAILGVVMVLSLVAALLISRTSQRSISEPIMALAKTAQSVSRNKDYRVRAEPTPSGGEVSVLIHSFNEMLAEIQQRDVALEERERLFRTLADSVSQMAWMAHPDGYIFWYNQRWYEYTGTTPEEMEGWGWQSVHDQKTLPEVMSKWRACIEAGRPFEMVFPLRSHSGEFRDFLTLITPVRDERGNVARWFGTNTDITQQRRSEEALRRSEKLAATGRLAASIAHEINNPLEAVTNLVYLARKYPLKAERYLDTADQELERIAEITKHTLGFFRDTSTPVKVNISEVLHQVLNLYERRLRFKSVVLKTRFEETMEVTGFPGEIRQVFSNLVANAVDAMGQNGHLYVKASWTRQWNNGLRPGIRVSVMDDGSGISLEQRGKIFEPFYTTKKDVGTGLGLWLTRGLVNKHSGTIHVKSRTDPVRTGTVFSVFLPLEPPAEGFPAVKSNQQPGETP